MKDVNISLKILSIENTDDLLGFYYLFNDELGMRIKNQWNTVSRNDLSQYLHKTKGNNQLFILIKNNNDVIGYYHINLNQQHLLAHVYFSFIWNMPMLTEIFRNTFSSLAQFLASKFNIERIVLPITGNEPTIFSLLLSHPEISQSLTLAQEHLDRNQERQPVTFFDYFHTNSKE